MINSFINIVYEQIKAFSIPIFIFMILLGIVFVAIKSLVLKRIKNQEINLITISMEILLVVCLCFFYQVTFLNREAGSRTDIIRLPFTRIFDQRGNLHFKELLYSLFNVFLFMPWGFFLSLHKRKLHFFRNVTLVAAYSFLVSLLIECMQLITQRGYFEIEDLICNVLGAIVGAMISNTFIIVTRRK